MYMEGEVNKTALLPKAMRPYFSRFKMGAQGVGSILCPTEYYAGAIAVADRDERDDRADHDDHVDEHHHRGEHDDQQRSRTQH